MMVVRQNASSITIASFTQGDVNYTVTFNEQHNMLESCTCPDFARNGPIICKHMFLVHRLEGISLPQPQQPNVERRSSPPVEASMNEYIDDHVVRPDPGELYQEAAERYTIEHNIKKAFYNIPFILYRFREATTRMNNLLAGLNASEYHDNAANIINSSAEQMNAIWSSLQRFKKSNHSGHHQPRY